MSKYSFFARQSDIRFHHHPDQLVERHAWTPMKLRPGFRSVSAKRVDLRRPQVSRVHLDEFTVIETGVRERDLAQLPNSMTLAGGYDVVVGLVCLQRQPHRLHVVLGVPPVAARV